MKQCNNNKTRCWERTVHKVSNQSDELVTLEDHESNQGFIYDESQATVILSDFIHQATVEQYSTMLSPILLSTNNRVKCCLKSYYQ